MSNVRTNSHNVVRELRYFAADHPDVEVELKVARPIYSLSLGSDVERGIFYPKAIENIINSYLIILLS